MPVDIQIEDAVYDGLPEENKVAVRMLRLAMLEIREVYDRYNLTGYVLVGAERGAMGAFVDRDWAGLKDIKAGLTLEMNMSPRTQSDIFRLRVIRNAIEVMSEMLDEAARVMLNTSEAMNRGLRERLNPDALAAVMDTEKVQCPVKGSEQ